MWYIGSALGFQPGDESSILSTRTRIKVYDTDMLGSSSGQDKTLPTSGQGFESPTPHQDMGSEPEVHEGSACKADISGLESHPVLQDDPV